jgi:hypothetical protein
MGTIKYEDLDKYFTKPKDWEPGKEGFFSRHKRLPRKLKKIGKSWAKKHTSNPKDINSALWNRVYTFKPNYCRFLIKLVTGTQ